MAEHINVMLSEEEINARIAELGEQISRTMKARRFSLSVFLRARAFSPVSLPSVSRCL